MIKHIAEHEFQMYVLESSKNLVIVDFWAPWCKPCQAMEPTWDSVSRRFTTQIDIVKVNVDDEPRIAQGAHVSSIPTIVYFKRGKIVRRDVGVKSEQDLTGIIADLLQQQ